MPLKIFFSWQSDTPTNTGRNFIERALERAQKIVQADAEVEAAIREQGFGVDRDTIGEPGSPPIVDTIFKKIDLAAIFAPDLTLLASDSTSDRLRIPTSSSNTDGPCER